MKKTAKTPPEKDFWKCEYERIKRDLVVAGLMSPLPESTPQTISEARQEELSLSASIQSRRIFSYMSVERNLVGKSCDNLIEKFISNKEFTLSEFTLSEFTLSEFTLSEFTVPEGWAKNIVKVILENNPIMHEEKKWRPDLKNAEECRFFQHARDTGLILLLMEHIDQLGETLIKLSDKIDWDKTFTEDYPLSLKNVAAAVEKMVVTGSKFKPGKDEKRLKGVAESLEKGFSAYKGLGHSDREARRRTLKDARTIGHPLRSRIRELLNKRGAEINDRGEVVRSEDPDPTRETLKLHWAEYYPDRFKPD